MRGSTHREALFDLAVGLAVPRGDEAAREPLPARGLRPARARAPHPTPARSRRRCSTSSRRCSAPSTSGSTRACASSRRCAQQTADQLRLLIAELRDDGAVRFVIERPDEVEAVFGLPLDALLEEMYGIGRERLRERRALLSRRAAAFEAARDCFARALAQTEADPAIERLLGLRAGHARLPLARLCEQRAPSRSVGRQRRAPEPAARGARARRGVERRSARRRRRPHADRRRGRALLDRLGGPAPGIRKRHGAGPAADQAASGAARVRK